jgi:thiosulfate dehydrogenase [quinone] large subunit
VYAGLQKLANPAYLDPQSPTSVVGQTQALRHSSPIGPLLGLSLHAPSLVGLMIAFGELAAGTGVLLGLWTRVAAVGGMLLSLTFFLTVSWSTTPYYYGSDIVFFFAWSVFAGLGAGGVLSVDGWLRHRARLRSGLPPSQPSFVVEASRLRSMCGNERSCGLKRGTSCAGIANCPRLDKADRDPLLRADLDRRQLLLGARAVGIVGAGALGLGGATALIGRFFHSNRANGPLSSVRRPTSVATPASKKPGTAQGTAIGNTSAVPVGQAGRFIDPKTGGQAWLVRPASNQFVAFSATCTHAGCTVGFDAGTMEFVCPCHGGSFSARTGQVLGGPPPSPLPSIPVHIVNGTIRVD